LNWKGKDEKNREELQKADPEFNQFLEGLLQAKKDYRRFLSKTTEERS